MRVKRDRKQSLEAFCSPEHNRNFWVARSTQARVVRDLLQGENVLLEEKLHAFLEDELGCDDLLRHLGKKSSVFRAEAQ